MAFTSVYMAFSLMISVFDFYLGMKCILSKKKKLGRPLAAASIMSGLVQIFYLGNAFTQKYFVASLFSSLYFVSISLALLFCMWYVVRFAHGKTNTFYRLCACILGIYMVLEIICMFYNVFGSEIIMSYVDTGEIISRFAFKMHPLYYVHLGYDYLLVLFILAIIVHRLIKVPREYRAQYRYIIIGIVGVVLLNIVFLAASSVRLDFSIWGYSITAAALYWTGFSYTETGFVSKLKNSVYDNINQGIVMFDFEDKLVLCNEKAKENLHLKEEDLTDMDLSSFMKHCSLKMDPKYFDISYTFQNFLFGRRYKCDYRIMINKDSVPLGRLFMFSDEGRNTDILTGFNNLGPFKQSAEENPGLIPSPMHVAVFDINNLSAINKSEGRVAGDMKIKELAEIMGRKFPAGTFFVRGNDATLVALVYGSNEKSMEQYITSIREEFNGSLQYAVSIMDTAGKLAEAVDSAEKAMRGRKLLDEGSKHSDSLKSLLKSLEACDTDTEAHVLRTQRMGSELGKRIGLTDVQQSQLALLCILHDIGKIAIPLEILNKPGKLTDEEWVIMKSHTDKGYAIANSSQELASIADMIRFHHERWDGRGYPVGLKGEEIPILSRIISVVDSYDAMINDRVYRPAISAEIAQNELKRCAGTQFDPYIVDAYLSMLAEPEFAAETEAQMRMVEERQKQKEKEEEEEKKRRSAEENYLHRIHPVLFSRYIIDAGMTIISTDNNFESLTGYSRDDIKAGTLTQLDLIPAEDREEYATMVKEKSKRDNLIYFEHPLLKKDGTLVTVKCCGKIMFDSVAKEQRSEIVIVVE